MRKIAVGLLVALVTMMAMSMQAGHEWARVQGVEADTKGAVLSFDTTIVQMGNVVSKKTPLVTAVFHFTNKGETPLVLHRVETSCGCTKVTYPEKPIPAGHKDSISVTYDSRRSSGGHFRKSITVHSNAVQQTTVLYIEGYVTTD